MSQKFVISESQLNRLVESENNDLKDIVSQSYDKNPDRFTKNIVDQIPELVGHEKKVKNKIVDLLLNNIGKVSVIGLLVLWMSVYIPYVINKNKIDDEYSKKTKVDTKTTNLEPIEKTPPNWEYEKEGNEMGDTSIYAKLKSSNQVNLRYPYGGTYGNIVIRKKNGKNEVLFIVNDGQMDVSIIDGVDIRVKFDDENPKTYSMSPAESGSYEVIFFPNPNNLIKKIKNSKKVVVEVPFFRDGRKIFTFDTENLNF